MNNNQLKNIKTNKAIFAGGCFWGVQTMFDNQPGVIRTVVGYTGGHTENPTYEEICRGNTGYFEATEIEYNPQKTDYGTLARYFFEIHDPTQASGQGPDIGEQYQSAVFYFDEEQKKTAEKLIAELKDKGFDVVTKVLPATKFWPAEEYHQHFNKKTGHTPYCHFYNKRF